MQIKKGDKMGYETFECFKTRDDAEEYIHNQTNPEGYMIVYDRKIDVDYPFTVNID